MIKELIPGKYYRLKLVNPWGEFIYDCKVIGTTLIDSKEDFSTFDIRGTFFNGKYGYGISDYLKLTESDIYIIRILKARRPIEIDSAEPILIPTGMVDLEGSVELLTVSYLHMTTSEFVRCEPSPTEMMNVRNALTDESERTLETYGPLTGENVQIDIEEEEGLLEQDAYDKMVEVKTEMLETTRLAQADYEKGIQSENRRLIDLRSSLNKREADLDAREATINAQLLELERKTAELRLIAVHYSLVKRRIMEVIEDIRRLEIAPQQIPTFEVFYADAVNDVL